MTTSISSLETTTSAKTTAEPTTTTTRTTTTTVRITDDEILMQYLEDHEEDAGIYWGNFTDERYCHDLKYFYDEQQKYEIKGKSAFEHEFRTISRIQQALFVAFVIFGFLFSIMSIGLRCDIWLNDEWSSNILFGFLPIIITTCLELV